MHYKYEYNQTILGAFVGIIVAVANWQAKIQVPIPGTPYYFHHVWVGIAFVVMSHLHPFERYRSFLFALGVILIADDAILHAANGTNLFW